MTRPRGPTIRRRGSSLWVVVLALALLQVPSLMVNPPRAQAANPCKAFAQNPVASTPNVVLARGYGACFDWTERLTVHVYAWRSRLNGSDASLRGVTHNSCLGRSRCPTAGHFNAPADRHPQCRHYWTRVVIDVMYKGTLTPIPNVDADQSDPPVKIC